MAKVFSRIICLMMSGTLIAISLIDIFAYNNYITGVWGLFLAIIGGTFFIIVDY